LPLLALGIKALNKIYEDSYFFNKITFSKPRLRKNNYRFLARFVGEFCTPIIRRFSNTAQTVSWKSKNRVFYMGYCGASGEYYKKSAD
jgi:hypothetical protein